MEKEAIQLISSLLFLPTIPLYQYNYPTSIKMPLSLGKLHLVLILLSISYCEEWYEPNSRMIS
jgi:hypothetical protein